MRILVDQDEVLCKWLARILQWYNADKIAEAKRHGLEFIPFSSDNVTNWDVKMNLGPDSEVYLRSYMRWPNFYQELDPVDGAIEGMRKLIADGHDVVVATTIPKCAGLAYEGKKEWLRKNIPEFDLDSFVGVKRKYLLDADILIDDGIHNIEPWIQKGKIGIIMDAVQNRSFDENAPHFPGHVYRAKGWKEILEIVDFYK